MFIFALLCVYKKIIMSFTLQQKLQQESKANIYIAKTKHHKYDSSDDIDDAMTFAFFFQPPRIFKHDNLYDVF